DYGAILKTTSGVIFVGQKEAPKPVHHSLVYPNPAAVFVNIRSQFNSGHHHLAIYDLQGRVVIEKELEEADTPLNISHLPAGVYFAKIWNIHNVEIIKILKN
ncbi:MAG: T9SS type A sorting domain-containing protein, partial [Bacteroidota bacterium]